MKKAGIVLSILCLMVSSCKEAKKDQNPETSSEGPRPASEISAVSFSSSQMEQVFREYQQLRVTLVASELESAQAAAGRLADVLGDEKGEQKSVSEAIAAAEGLEEQRKLFSQLTASLDPMFRQALTDGEIYQQFCPMAFEGKGGYWISDKEEIRNPYYGDRMLTCGKVTGIIKR